MSDDDGTNVTPLPVKPKAAPQKPLTVVYSYGGCRHVRAIVDETLNELECADCHEKLNPIKFLITMANRLTSWDYEAANIRKLRQQLEERSRCRCLNCGEWTEIRAVGISELQSIRRRNGKPAP